MQKFMDKMEEVLTPIANKVGANKVLNAISAGFNHVMPIIILGALFSVLSTLSIGGYQEFLKSTGLITLFSLVGKFTTGLLAVYVAFAAAFSYVKNEGDTAGAAFGGLLSILSFFIMIPLANVTIKETTTTYIAFDYLGAKGLFTALLVGIIVGVVYTLFVKKEWVIKMPDGVPPTVAKSFNAIIPAVAIVVLFLTINGIFSTLTGATFSEWFYKIISSNISGLSSSIMACIFLRFIACLFWFFGIHGGQIIYPFTIMLFMQAGIDNQAAYAAGDPMQNIVTFGFMALLVLGGNGNTLGLSIDMLFAKSKRYKTLGKLAILPSCCNINEPIMFGLPMVLNPIMAIPFFLVGPIVMLITYFAMSAGLVSLPRLAMGAAGTPILLDGWLMCGISGIILQIVLIIISALLYYPFFKIQDNIALKEEQALEE